MFKFGILIFYVIIELHNIWEWSTNRRVFSWNYCYEYNEFYTLLNMFFDFYVNKIRLENVFFFILCVILHKVITFTHIIIFIFFIFLPVKISKKFIKIKNPILNILVINPIKLSILFKKKFKFLNFKYLLSVRFLWFLFYVLLIKTSPWVINNCILINKPSLSMFKNYKTFNSKWKFIKTYTEFIYINFFLIDISDIE